jgi:hypothetical protein
VQGPRDAHGRLELAALAGAWATSHGGVWWVRADGSVQYRGVDPGPSFHLVEVDGRISRRDGMSLDTSQSTLRRLVWRGGSDVPPIVWERGDKADLVCSQCISGSKGRCLMHGECYIQWKCRYCCSPAAYHCWGTTHFCTSCHEIVLAERSWDKLRELMEQSKCEGGAHCPLGCPHPPHGLEFCLGCVLCKETCGQQNHD